MIYPRCQYCYLLNLICFLWYWPTYSKNVRLIYNLAMKFISDEDKLEAGLFTAYEARFGAQTTININFIPDLLQHIKRHLTSQELIRLEDYHLQNYLMELSISYREERSLSRLSEIILKHIRGSNNFWYRHNNQEQINQEQQLKHHAIESYHRDIEHIKEAFGRIDNHFAFEPSYARKTTQAFEFQLLHKNTEPHFGTRQPLNYLAYIPSFLSFKYHRKALESNGHQRIRVEEHSPNPQQKMHVLKECIVFLLSNKSEVLPTYKSNRDNSNPSQEPSSKSESDPNLSNQLLPQTNILQQFLEFVQKEPSLIKFPNSHHLHVLTCNLIDVCRKVYEALSEPQRVQAKRIESETCDLKSMIIDPQLKQAIAMIADKSLSEAQVALISTRFLLLWESGLKAIMSDMRSIQNASIDQRKGWLSTPAQIARIKEQYQQMLDNPSFVELTKYRALGTGIPWKDEDYLKFLKGLSQFFNIPTNNKKIALSMGEGFEPNHVKHVKGVYLTVMKERLERGECGGGKRGKCLSKLDFIEKDINNFSLRWFEKAKKIKKRKQKRRRKNSDSNEPEDDLDSEY